LLTAENDSAAGVQPSGHNIIPQKMARTVLRVRWLLVLAVMPKFWLIQ
jgi:hypothetical protein